MGHRKERTGEDSICNIQPPCLNESCVRDGYVRVHTCAHILSDESRSSWEPMMESACCHGDHSITQNSKDNGMSQSKFDIPRHKTDMTSHN